MYSLSTIFKKRSPTGLRTQRMVKKELSEDIQKPGDYCFVQSLKVASEKIKPHSAIVMKCPFCSNDMATTMAHTIEFKKTIIDRLCGYQEKIHVKGMIQCPYNSLHKFEIKHGKVIAI